MGQRRVEKAVRPVLFALADKEMASANGVFIELAALILSICSYGN